MNNVQMVNIEDFTKYIGLSLHSKGFSVSPLKLQKLLYYTQAWHMVFFGRENTLFVNVPQAWVNGPVYPVIYDAYKDKVSGMCEHLNISDFEEKDVCVGFKVASEKLGLTEQQINLL